MKHIKAVLFDVGETILEPRRTFSQSILEMAPNIELVQVEIIDKFITEQIWFSPLKLDHTVWTNDNRIADELYKYYYCVLEGEVSNPSFFTKRLVDKMARSDAWKLIDGTIELLEELKHANKRLGVVSNWNSDLGTIFKKKGINHYFDVVICSAVVGRAKPDHSIFKYAVEQIQSKEETIEYQDIVMIGDSYRHDILPAINLGMRGIFISNRKHQKSNDRYVTVKSLREIKENIIGGLI